jgi:hypothetical protein
MPYAVTTLGSVLYVSWRGFTVGELHEVAEQIADLRRVTSRWVVYLSRIPADNHVFTPAEHAALLEFLLTILPNCASIHHVIEGMGFVKSARRATVTNMALSTPRPNAFHTHATISEAIRAIEEAYAVAPSELEDARRANRKRSTPLEGRARAAGAEGAFCAAARIAQRPQRKA